MAGERGGSGRRARPADHERATSWDKVSNWDSGQRLHTRDVHDRQQLDRTRIDPAQTKTRLRIVVGIATVLVLLAMVFVLVGLEWGFGQVLVILGRAKANRQPGFWQLFFTPVSWRWLLALAAALLAGGMVHLMAYRQMQAQNLMNDTSDVNQHAGDQHIALPEEIVRKFDWFPDVGAHSAVAVSSMISHVMLTNKGLNRVRVPKRAVGDVLGPDGEVVLYQGEQVYDDNDEPVMESAPLIDEGFGEDLFETSGLPGGKAGKRLRRRYDASVVPYNPDGKNRDKLGRFGTVADMINTDWELPDYEPQRPAGAYLVDTAPVNTMVLAITRAGKGQTVIEPTIDMWSREKNPQNMVINDPKGELLVKNYVRFTRRGYQVVQFNLINSMKTDIYNPLGLAAEAAREGDVVKCAMYVENIAEVFFPLDGGDDPFWANSANNAFKRVAYGLIDYYMEQERELRARAARQNMPAKILAQQIDELWGKVTLYNCYQFFVQLSAKKRKSPLTTCKERVDRGEFMNAETGEVDQHAQDLAQEQAAAEAELWNGQPEIDLLSLYFAATEQLPQNSIRTLIANANNSLKSMGGAEKTISTVYGIAITAMSFFTDPTIMRLTSGTPSQNVDMGGLSFPRRFGVRFAPEYLERERLVGTQCVWNAYDNDRFTDNLGEDFEHSDTVSPEGWARYYFLGMFPARRAYLQLELRNATTGLLVKRFRFRFDKDYQTSLDGRVYVTDPVTGEKIVRNGVLVEMRPEARAAAEGANPRWVPGHSWFKQRTLSFDEVSGKPVVTPRPSHVFTQTMVRYSEKPRAVFMVTPPHLMKYAKLLLILIKQLVDLNFDKSYMTKANQKPLYKTRFMLDELGNLQSEGHGISGFETMLSIGLGQDQQFTIILQTLQQLRDVYGDSVDRIVQGNAQPLDAKIATPTGWKTMGEMAVGDQVLTPAGGVTEVTGVFPRGVRPVYRVTLRDGSSTEVCNEHLWSVERWKACFTYLGGKDENGRRRRIGSNDGKFCERVAETIDTDELKRRVDDGRQIDLPRVSPVAYLEADLPVDPYVLGVIVGDGHVQPNGVVKLTCADAEIVKEVRRRGYTVVDNKAHGKRIGGIEYRINGVNKVMRGLGLSGKRSWEKSIPATYLRGSVQQRTDLLRGLMDTDGTISRKGEMEFTSASRELAEGVQDLVRSLGGRVAINVKTRVMYTAPNQLERKAARPAYRVQNIRLWEVNPFLLPRKAERYRQRTDSSGQRVVSVEYVGEAQVQCIAVADEAHLYLTDDFIPTHNTSNIVFLKSTDDAMIETLEKMSGKRHVVYRDSKTVTKDVENIIEMTNVEGKVSYTMSVREEPVISYNDMAFIGERQSIVFRAGDAPVWNRNETILPMSWRLYRDTITMSGRDYTLQTIPTLSTAGDYDPRRNQPDFNAMLQHRKEQALLAAAAQEAYREAFGYTEVEITRLDPDVYSDEVMSLIDRELHRGEDTGGDREVDEDEAYNQQQLAAAQAAADDDEDNVEVLKAAARAEAEQNERNVKRYAMGSLSREDIDGQIEQEIVLTYCECGNRFWNDSRFRRTPDGGLTLADGTPLITRVGTDDAALRDASNDPGSRVFAEDGAVDEALHTSWMVTGAFYAFLRSLGDWSSLAGGDFDRSMAQRIHRRGQ